MAERDESGDDAALACTGEGRRRVAPARRPAMRPDRVERVERGKTAAWTREAKVRARNRLEMGAARTMLRRLLISMHEWRNWHTHRI